jgi:transcriptional regulator with XRE-family HTH domain
MDDCCWPCQEAKRTEATANVVQLSSSAALLSSSYRSTFTLQSILHTVQRTKPVSTSDVGQALKIYRNTHRLTQHELAMLLGFDQSYISKLENGQGLRDIVVLKDIADRLGLPPHWLGLIPQDYATKHSTELLAIAPSVISLSKTVRETGRAHEAVNELWPLILRLEAQATQDRENPRLLLTLASGQATLGVILGDLLPEEDLFVSIHFFKKAVAIAEELGDDSFKTEVYWGCGNELRKNKQYTEAIYYLERALSLAPGSVAKGFVTALLARAYGEMGDQSNFDDVIENVLHFLDKAPYFTPIFNPVMIHEVHLRGLINVGHINRISPLVERNDISTMTVYIAPQWHTISQLTLAEAMFRIGKFDDGLAKLQTALIGAELCKLPHQVQRAMRSLKLVEAYEPAQSIAHKAQTLLDKLSHPPLQIALPKQ